MSASPKSSDAQSANTCRPAKELRAAHQDLPDREVPGVRRANVIHGFVRWHREHRKTQRFTSCRLLSTSAHGSVPEDHNRPLTCENVELRGFEPLTSCMPCNSSDLP